jgi:hypothetical protein
MCRLLVYDICLPVYAARGYRLDVFCKVCNYAFISFLPQKKAKFGFEFLAMEWGSND